MKILTRLCVECFFPLILKIDFTIYFSDKMSQMTSRRSKIRMTAFNGCYYPLHRDILTAMDFRDIGFPSYIDPLRKSHGVYKKQTENIRHTIHFHNVQRFVIR